MFWCCPLNSGLSLTLSKYILFQVVHETTNAILVRSIIRKVGHRCSRTDLHYRFKAGGAWDKKKKENEEKAKNPPPAPAPPVPAAVVKKVSVS